MSTLDQFARAKLDELCQKNLHRRLAETERLPAGAAVRDGRTLISFSCNDYLDLTQHENVKRAAVAAIERYGAGACASRLVSGNHPLYAELEARLARLKGVEASCVFGSGYLANIGILPTLVGPGDLIVADRLVHACLHAGAALSRAEVVLFDHNDVGDCAKLLSRHRAEYRHCLMLTEGVYSMDGDRAPLAALAAIARDHESWLLVDDAHGFGVLGGGRGSPFAESPAVEVDLQMGTLSKAVGAYGGYLCASQEVIELIVNRARSLIYSTGLPPSVVASAIAALEVIETDAELVEAPLRKARLFTECLGLDEAESAIVPLVVGEAERALSGSAALAEAGFLVVAIRPPTVPEGTARLRFTFSAGHRDADIVRLAEAVHSAGLAG